MSIVENCPKYCLHDKARLSIRVGLKSKSNLRLDLCHGRVIRNQQNLFPIFLLLP